MAKTNEYLDEAYSTLLDLSADDLKRLEYETRERALRDYNSQMESAERRGLAKGEELGQKLGQKIGQKIGEEREREYGIQVLIETCQEMGFAKEMTMKKIMEKYNLTSEEAQEKTSQYWKQKLELK